MGMHLSHETMYGVKIEEVQELLNQIKEPDLYSKLCDNELIGWSYDEEVVFGINLYGGTSLDYEPSEFKTVEYDLKVLRAELIAEVRALKFIKAPQKRKLLAILSQNSKVLLWLNYS